MLGHNSTVNISAMPEHFFSLSLISNIEENTTHLAALTGEQTVVISRHLVSAHWTHLIQVFIVGVVHHFKLGGCKAQTEKKNTGSKTQNTFYLCNEFLLIACCCTNHATNSRALWHLDLG